MSDMIKETYRSATDKIQVSPEALARAKAAAEAAMEEAKNTPVAEESKPKVIPWYRTPAFRRNAGLVAACLCVVILGLGVYQISQIRMGAASKSDEMAVQETTTAVQAVMTGEAVVANDEAIPAEVEKSAESSPFDGEAETMPEVARPETAEEKDGLVNYGSIDEETLAAIKERLFAGDCISDYDAAYLTEDDILSVELKSMPDENGAALTAYEFICKVNEAMHAAYPDAPETIAFTVIEE
ncbi:MAG: hypothetical protein IJ744_02860 [Lachnospiraceae bacterium]|nr:hypothetical protein [Lachnospiraceae bacterium]